MEEKEKQGGLSGWRPVIIAIIASAAAIICTAIFINGLVSYKKTGGSSGILATGSASVDFESDLVVWRGSFSVHGDTPKDAYGTIKQDAELVKKYLEDSQVLDTEMTLGSVSIAQSYASRYNDEGQYMGDEPSGYDLTQSLVVSSTDLDKVEKISRDITTLIESGVQFESEQPEYYYTKLDELKLDLIDKATANARERIDIIARGAGAGAGSLLSANLGVFQITPTNSGSGSYSYDGAFDTSARYKTAMVTVRLNYTAE